MGIFSYKNENEKKNNQITTTTMQQSKQVKDVN